MQWWRWAVIGVASTIVGTTVALVALRNHNPWPARLVFLEDKASWSLGFSSDGRWFRTQNQKEVTSWDVATGQPRRTPTTEHVGDKTLSKDGRNFAGSMVDEFRNGLVVWGDAATGAIKAKLPTRSGWAPQLMWVAEGRKIQFFSQDRNNALEVVTWDIASGEETRRAIQGPGSVLGPGASYGGPVAYSPDGRTLAYIDLKRDDIQLWDAESDRAIGGLLRTSTTRRRPSTWGRSRVLFSPNGRTMIADGGDGLVEFWDVADCRLIKAIRLHPRGYNVFFSKISPDGRTLASTGCVMKSPSKIVRAWEFVWTLLTSKDARDLTLEAVVIDLDSDRPLVRLPGSTALAISPDGRTIATWDVQGTWSLRDIPRPPRR